MFFSQDPIDAANVPDSEKLSHVYAYVLRKEKEETAAKFRKWAWWIFIIFSVYLSYIQLFELVKNPSAISSIVKSFQPNLEGLPQK